MSGWQIVAIILAGILVYGIGYGTGIADAKVSIIQSFRDFGFWTYDRTKVVSSEVTTITPTPPPPRPVPPAPTPTPEESKP